MTAKLFETQIFAVVDLETSNIFKEFISSQAQASLFNDELNNFLNFRVIIDFSKEVSKDVGIDIPVFLLLGLKLCVSFFIFIV
jgi:hypothetical protein